MTIAIAAIEGGCSTVPADSGCKVFKPLTWSKKDTPQTQRGVVAHNRAYDAICPSGALHG